MKFGNLLKKELSELITKQAILMLVFVVFIYIFMGNIMGSAMKEEDKDDSFSEDGKLTICVQDSSEFTKTLLEKIKAKGIEINMITLESDNYDTELDRLELKKLLIIPEGYGDSIVNEKTAGELKLVKKLSVGGLSSSFSSLSDTEAIDIIRDTATDEILLKEYGVTGDEIEKIQKQTSVVDYTSFNGKTAQVSSDALQGVIMAESMIAPFVIFFLLIMASSMIMTAISTEKIDKTLETLLSTPVSRMTVLMAKMVAALISALLNAAVMMIGFAFYALGMVGGIGDIASSAAGSTEELSQAVVDTGMSTAQAMQDLGLTLSAGSYVLFGLQLFLTVAIGLSLSLILGAMATDAKSVQTLTLPMMLMVLVPFFITMFLDINTVSLPFRVIMYLIPFTHTYTAISNLVSGNLLTVWVGLGYQIIFFAACMFLAVKMFTTDKLFTIGVPTDAAKKKGGLFAKNTLSK